MTVDKVWRRSTWCGSEANCVEVATHADGFAVRDGKNPVDGTLTFSGAAWLTFLTGIRAGEFDNQ